jgi:hypothetical protein
MKQVWYIYDEKLPDNDDDSIAATSDDNNNNNSSSNNKSIPSCKPLQTASGS